MDDDLYFYPLICCVSCANVTKDWGWVENPDDNEVYGVCKKCEEKVKREGLRVFKPSTLEYIGKLPRKPRIK